MKVKFGNHIIVQIENLCQLFHAKTLEKEKVLNKFKINTLSLNKCCTDSVIFAQIA